MTMDAATIAREFKERVCEAVSLQPVALDRYYVETPFLLPGGDAVPVILEDRPGGWRLTDDGETFMQLALLQPNFDQGNRWKVIQSALKSHRVDAEAGVLSLSIPNALYAEALSSFIQAILEVMDVRHWTREVVRETFREDASALVASVAPRAQFDYQDTERDPGGLYKLDAFLPGERNIGVLFVGNDDQCKDATITLYQWERWNERLRSVVLFRDEEEIGRKPRAQLGDIAHKSFSSLGAARERLPAWFEEVSA